MGIKLPKFPKSKKKKAAEAQAKKDSTRTAHERKMFDKYSDPHKACAVFKDSKGKRTYEDCMSFAEKYTEDYLEREYGVSKDKKKKKK